MYKRNKWLRNDDETKKIISKRQYNYLSKKENYKIKNNEKFFYKKRKCSKITFIIAFSLTFGLFILYTFRNFINNNNNNNILMSSSNITEFYDILPKINLENNNNTNYLQDIFNSRELFINDKDLTGEYIKFIRPINEEEEKKYMNKLYENIKPKDYQNKTRQTKQFSFVEYFKICIAEKLINEEKFNANREPLVSIIVVSFNKEQKILKSIRSIQNQSLKNIEIIIVDDCSTDNSTNIFKYLLESDSRIRVFTHLKNMGVWRSRLDGFLYSRAKYIIHFDVDDFYTDNYILEDSYDLVTKYQLDSVKFAFIMTKHRHFPYSRYHIVKYRHKDKRIAYGKRNYDLVKFRYGAIWNRLTRANIITKGLYSFNSYMLNAYKNLWEDRCWNQLINENSFSYLMVNRIGYLYILDNDGEGSIKLGDDEKNNKIIREFIYFWLFDLHYLSKEDNKAYVINHLKSFIKTKNEIFHIKVNLNYLTKRFKPYEYLLNSLIEDNYVSSSDKEFVKNLLKDYNNKTLQT